MNSPDNFFTVWIIYNFKASCIFSDQIISVLIVSKGPWKHGTVIYFWCHLFIDIRYMLL